MQWLHKLPARIRDVVIFAPIPILMVLLSVKTAWVLFFVVGFIAIYEWRWVIFQRRDLFYSRNSRVALAMYCLSFIIGYFSLELGLLAGGFAGIIVYLGERNSYRVDAALGQWVVTLIALLAFDLRAVEAQNGVNASGLALFGLVLIVTTFSDSAAYFVGKAIGRHKFAPVISPNKTWEGAIGGWIVAMIAAFIYSAYFLPGIDGWPLMGKVILFWAMAFAGQMGDLGESLLKRKNNIKDSGTTLRSHGGVLDRFDSLGPVVVILMLALWISN